MAFPARWLASMRSRDYEIGIKAFDSGLYEEAVEHFQRCLNATTDPGTGKLAGFYIGESFSALGQRAMETKSWERADEYLSAAYEQQPSHADLCYKLAFVKRKLGLPAEALSSLARALEINPNYARAILLQSILWYESGRQPDAIARIRNAGVHDSSLDFRLVQEALSAHTSGDKEQFLIHMERALDERSTAADAAARKGDTAFREGRYADAISEFTRCLEEFPGYADLHCRLGESFLELDMPEDALESLSCALQINPNYLEAQYHAARALIAMRRHDEAKAVLGEILALSPDHASAKDLLERDAA